MKARIVRIGNSQGIRIPKPLLKETGLAGEVEIHARNSTLVIAPVKKKPRAGWAAACREMSKRDDDKLLDPELMSATTFDEEEWEW